MAYKRTVDLGSGFDVNALWANDRARLAATKKKPKDFWLDQISTGGGIAGALGGAAAGAAAGSVVPGLGTAVGGILGALLGGGAGSAAGEIGENAITGDQWDKNVLKEGLIGGATSLPIGAGFKLARAGLKAGTGFGRTGARELVEQAGAKVVPKAMQGVAVKGATKSRIGKNLEKLSGQMLNSQTQVTGAQARRMGLRPVEAMGRVNKRTGLTNFDDMAELSRNLTGAGDGSILDVLTREAVGSTNGVKLDDLRSVATRLLDDKGTILTRTQRARVLENVKNASTSMRGGSQGSLSALANPNEALNQANTFRSAAQTIRSQSITAKPEQIQEAKIYDGLAKTIEDALYKSPGVNSAVPDLARFGSTSLREMAGEARAAGNAAQANAYMKLSKELGGMKNVQQLRKMKKDFVDIGKMDEVTAQADGARQFNAESASSMMKGSPIRGTLAAMMNAGMPRAAGQVGRAGRALQGTPGAAGRATQNIPMLGLRQGAGRLLTADEVPQDQGLIDPATGLPLTDNQITNQMDANGELPGSQIENIPQEPSVGGVTKSQLEEAMMMAAADGEEDALSQLKAMYDLLPEGPDLSSSTAQLAAKQATGMQALDQLEGAFNSAGGGQGVLGGNIANVAGEFNINSAAGAFNDQVAGTARQIARAMGEVGAGSDADAQAFISRLPRLTDSPERAAQKIAELRALLQAARENTMLYGAGAQEQYGANA
jgi:hypothetical protein